MSELRENIIKELRFKDEADDDIADYIIDAIIEALPAIYDENRVQVWNEGATFMLETVLDVLRAAKS